MTPITLLPIRSQDDERIELLQALASKDSATRQHAMEIIAAFAGPLVNEVLDQMATHKLIYGEAKEYNLGLNEDPDIPIDPWLDISEGFINIWMSGQPGGGLFTNHITGPFDTFRLRTTGMETAVSMKKAFARQARIDVLEQVFNFVLREFLVKTEFYAWDPLMKALAGYRGPTGTHNLIDSTIAGKLHPADFSRLLTLAARLRPSWVGGTAATNITRGVTHLFVSPELLEDLRSYAYDPANTTAIPDTDESTAMPLPDAMRTDIFQNSGLPSVFGIKILSINELGVGQAWTQMFDRNYAPVGGDPGFTVASDELAVAVDLNMSNSFLHVRGKEPEDEAPLAFIPDDQFRSREKKVGWSAELRQGFGVLDARSILGIIV